MKLLNIRPIFLDGHAALLVSERLPRVRAASSRRARCGTRLHDACRCDALADGYPYHPASFGAGAPSLPQRAPWRARPSPRSVGPSLPVDTRARGPLPSLRRARGARPRTGRYAPITKFKPHFSHLLFDTVWLLRFSGSIFIGFLGKNFLRVSVRFSSPAI